MAEIWKEIEGFPAYSISNTGFVYNHRTEEVMKVSATHHGDLKVTLVQRPHRITRTIRVLVAEAFLPKPSEAFDTVIMLDNDRGNVDVSNLAWRPRWFAWQFSRQFNNTPTHFERPMRIFNTRTGTIYGSVIEVAISEGVLMNDVWRSIHDGSVVFPTGATYAVH